MTSISLRGKHQIAFGGEIFRTQDNQNDEYNDSGTFSFTGIYSDDPLLDFLTGLRCQASPRRCQQDYSYRQTLVALYGQDTIRLTPKLVMNVGLRWEPTLPPHDYFNRGSVFSLAGFYPQKPSTGLSQRPTRPVLLGRPRRQQVFYLRPLAEPLSSSGFRL